VRYWMAMYRYRSLIIVLTLFIGLSGIWLWVTTRSPIPPLDNKTSYSIEGILFIETNEGVKEQKITLNQADSKNFASVVNFSRIELKDLFSFGVRYQTLANLTIKQGAVTLPFVILKTNEGLGRGCILRGSIYFRGNDDGMYINLLTKQDRTR
jgi:hypothetical protein